MDDGRWDPEVERVERRSRVVEGCLPLMVDFCVAVSTTPSMGSRSLPLSMTEDEDEDEPEAKRLRSSEAKKAEWRVFDANISCRIQAGDEVFFRSKSATQLGRRGRLIERVDADKNKWSIQYETGERHIVSGRRCLPVYASPSPSPRGLKIIITSETVYYRQLAASQLQSTDAVLELGCSTGETSNIIWKYAKSWIGLDTSLNMIQTTRERLAGLPHRGSCNTKCEKMDILMDPKSAVDLVRSHQNTTAVYVDIGGNREEVGVVRALAWVMESFENLRVIVVKSQQVFNGLRKKASESGLVCNGDVWFAQKLGESRTLPKHPLQAPKVFSPKDASTPICRYHNYYVDGCGKGSACPYDHVHCHFCLQPGHVAKQCPVIEKRHRPRP
jgi:SAM-dependent methyltransferase